MSDLILAILQSDIHWEDVDANLAMFEEKIWAIDQQVNLILLPESFNAGFTDNIEKIVEVPGLKTTKWLLQMASQSNALVGGSFLVNDKGRLYNRYLMAHPDGTFDTYDKKHLFNLSDIEKKLTRGEKRTIIDYKGWRICPMVCYDLRFPSWSQNFIHSDGRADYDLLIYSANWPKPRISAWDTLLQARAIENQSYVVGVNRIGADRKGLEYPGHSSVVDYTGEVIQTLDAEGSIIQRIEKEPMDLFRQKLPFIHDVDTAT